MRGFEGCEGVVRLAVCGALLGSFTPRFASAEPGDPETTVAAPVSRVQIGNGHAADAVRRAIQGANQRLAQPRCQQVLSEFNDVSGVPLQQSLAASGSEADAYLDALFFYDGSALRTCGRRHVMAFTAPGSRVIHVCAEKFNKTYRRNQQQAEVTIIHEMLHSLGLGENPPTSAHITSRVLKHCR